MSLDPQRHPGIADVFYAQRVRERVARGVLEVRGAKAPVAGAPARPAMYARGRQSGRPVSGHFTASRKAFSHSSRCPPSSAASKLPA